VEILSPKEELVEMRCHGNPANPVLIYLPGLHGDWTLIATFRKLISENFYFIEFTYPRTLQWNLTDYAHAVDLALFQKGIRKGWILAESFSSQVLWELLEDHDFARSFGFTCYGVILAGGFVKYPINILVQTIADLLAILPWRLWKVTFWIYAKYSHFRHRNAPESAESVKEFVNRRTPEDIAAIRHRLNLIATNDPSTGVKQVRCPIYLLAGIFDPIVPTWPVLRWLRMNCRRFQSHKIIWPADHNVLGTEPAQAVRQIESWIR